MTARRRWAQSLPEAGQQNGTERLALPARLPWLASRIFEPRCRRARSREPGPSSGAKHRGRWPRREIAHPPCRLGGVSWSTSGQSIRPAARPARSLSSVSRACIAELLRPLRPVAAPGRSSGYHESPMIALAANTMRARTSIVRSDTASTSIPAVGAQESARRQRRGNRFSGTNGQCQRRGVCYCRSSGTPLQSVNQDDDLFLTGKVWQ